MTAIHIYIIGSHSDEKICKIGIAINPKKRLAQLQTGSHAKLYVAATYACQSRDIARHREQAAHKTFSDYRLSGEWFGVSPDEVVASSSQWFLGKPNKAVFKDRPRDSVCSDFKPFHPVIPQDLFGVPISQMKYEDRVRFWAAHNLAPPPEGFDDWYMVGNQSTGVIGAFPVEGFVCQEPKQ